MKILLGIMMAAVILAGWRNLPPLDQPSAGAAGLAMGLALLVAFVAGERSSRGKAMATAMAAAEARASAIATGGSANAAVQVIIDAEGAARRRARFEGLDNVPWIDRSAVGPSEDQQDVWDSVREDVTDHA